MSETGRPDDKPEEARSGKTSVPDSVDEAPAADTSSEATGSGSDGPAAPEPPPAPETSPAPRPRGVAGAWVLAIIAIILAFIAAGDSVYLWYQASQSVDRVTQRVSQLSAQQQTQSQSLQQHMQQLSQSLSRVDQIANTQQQESQKLQSLKTQVSQASQRLSKLSDLLHSSRRTWEMVQIQHLLTVANDRLQLSRDVPGAISALGIAQQRLAQADDPGLIPVRQAVSKELQQLRSVQQVDVAGMAIQLATLAQQVPQLPLKRSIPTHYSPPSSKAAPAPTSLAWWQRTLHSVTEALNHMVTIRRTETPTPALMAPGHEFFLYQNLQLKLESARLALLQRHTQVFRQTLHTAGQWLDTYFKADDADVRSMKQALASMAQRELKPSLPDISASLHRLRQRLQALREAGTAAASGQGSSQ